MVELTRLKQNAGWILLCLLNVGNFSLGSFTFTAFPKPDNTTCKGEDVILIWNYITDETVLNNEWFKQPENILIADTFGGTFNPKGSYVSRVTQYDVSTYKAAIKLTGLTSDDAGEYSCRVTASAVNIQNGEVKYAEPPNGNVQIDHSNCRKTKCLPPSGTTGVTITVQWMGKKISGEDGVYDIDTCKGGQFICDMTGGPASCGNASYSLEKNFEECCPTICCPQWCLLMYFISMAIAAAICLVPIWALKWKVKKTWIKKGLAILISVAVVIFAIITGVAFGIDASKNGSACAIDCSGLGSNCPCKLNAFLIGLLGLIEIPFAIWFVKYHTEVNKDTEDESAAAGEDNENGCPKKCKGMMSSSSCCPLNTIHCSSDDDNNTTIKNIPDEKTDAEISLTDRSNRLPAITVEGKKKKKKKKNKNQEPSKTSHRDLPSLPENTDPLPPIKK